MYFKPVKSKNEPMIKSKEERLSEFKRSAIWTVVLLVFFLLVDITFMSQVDVGRAALFLFRIVYSASFVISIHVSRVVYWTYQLENQLREQGIETDDDIRRLQKEMDNDKTNETS